MVIFLIQGQQNFLSLFQFCFILIALSQISVKIYYEAFISLAK